MLLFIIAAVVVVVVVVILSYDNAYLRGKNLQKFYRQTFKLNGTWNTHTRAEGERERETFLLQVWPVFSLLKWMHARMPYIFEWKRLKFIVNLCVFLVLSSLLFLSLSLFLSMLSGVCCVYIESVRRLSFRHFYFFALCLTILFRIMQFWQQKLTITLNSFTPFLSR